MTFSFESLFEFGVVGFYMLDATKLLCVNEFLYLESGGMWGFSGLGRHIELMGRNLWVPNPFTPGYFFIRVYWPSHARYEEPGEIETLETLIGALKPLRFFTFGLFFSLLLGPPIAFSRFGGHLAMIVLVCVVYGTILSMLAITFQRRRALLVSGSAFGKLAFDCLVCPPLALNLVPRLSGGFHSQTDPLLLGRKLLDATSYQHMVKRLMSQERP